MALSWNYLNNDITVNLPSDMRSIDWELTKRA